MNDELITASALATRALKMGILRTTPESEAIDRLTAAILCLALCTAGGPNALLEKKNTFVPEPGVPGFEPTAIG